MSGLKVFHKSVQGASHIQSGKPCQDYSLSYDMDGIQVLIVCDGHGGNTYFRSDVGAKIAAQITLDCLVNFAKCVSPASFVDKSFSITAQPKRNPFIDIDGRKLKYNELSEDQKKLARQAQSFFDSECKFKEEQEIIRDLLTRIISLWEKEIESDVRKKPFSKKEKDVLNGHGNENAYGCTLLAFLRTKDYWLSFHIGDGKIYICNQSLAWKMPVPEDCTCFLNYTTSLCDSNPLKEFRYAFCGEGEPPFAVFLCSDGLDGSLRTSDNIQDFYEQIVGLALDGDDIESELLGYLPKLSETGNRDDISLAGFVDLSKVNLSAIRHSMDLKKRTRDIHANYRSRKTEIENLDARIEALKLKCERLKDARFSKQVELDDMRQEIKKRETEMEELDKSVNSSKKDIEELRAELKNKKNDFENWKFTVKNEMAELEMEQSGNDELSENNKTDYTNW